MMSTEEKGTLHEGECTCQMIKYELLDKPLFVHACHCTWCQRETGSAFVLNAIIETSKVKIISSESPQIIHTPSESGTGQNIARCRRCQVALWSHYGGNGELLAFVRVGTLKEGSKMAPSIHIYTSSKQPWLTLETNVPIMPEFYPTREYWPQESLDRLQKAISQKANDQPITSD